MANARHDRGPTEDSSSPGAEGTPPKEISPATAQSRVILEAIQPTISELRRETNDVAAKVDRHLLYVLGAFAAGVVLLTGMFMYGYTMLQAEANANYQQLNSQSQNNYNGLAGQVAGLSNQVTKVSTQIDDMTKYFGEAGQTGQAK